jgi:hypothetical protein
MEIIESKHWQYKKSFRASIEAYMIEYAILYGSVQRDRHNLNVLNSIVLIPQTGKTLKVVFRYLAKDKVKLIAAYYLD